ncbi:MerR family transcriptional regulator [Bradyrhizobium sp. CB1717]|uniref:MerR family transcriptional regulator n=1 Tax=Bradyrhizobium sp. CB1717 TaxID=3039154 RepID=UPI0024B0425B|nr:MerR family transcriptional regulator [Bradyrhizobium sp. CB1717]WFU23637.1 MerR family transcriptional regulator [Bradyrhizobium sp. CB1717]
MTIGELARRTGLSHSRIRFYEREGLLTNIERRPNGYRRYPPEAAGVLDLIKTAQEAGFSLDEIRALLPLDSSRGTHKALLDTLRCRVETIEAFQARLEQTKSGMIALITTIERKPIGSRITVPSKVYRVKSDEAGPMEEVIEEKMFGEIVIREVPKKTDRRRR